MYVLTPEQQMPNNKIRISAERKRHEALFPQPFTSRVIRLAFDKWAIGGEGDLPGLCGIFLFGHEPEEVLRKRQTIHQGGTGIKKKIKS
jgi:hypothetical protein